MGSGTGFESVSSSISVVGRLSSSSRFHERLSITSTLLNGKNYAIWEKAVEIYYLGEIQFHYLTDDPSDALQGSMVMSTEIDLGLQVCSF